MTQATAVKAAHKLGKKSVVFPGQPSILADFTVAGPMEGAGPLGKRFDTILPDTYYGEKCWEQTESKMLKESVLNCINKAGGTQADIDLLFSGDLLAQTISSSFAAKDIEISHFGLFSACATFAEGLILASMSLEGGFASHAVVAVSSHHDSAERQFRFPTELGVQRPSTAQWTTTLAAAILVGYDSSPLGEEKLPIRVTGGTIGEVFEMGIKDPYDMGTAMAPAAVDTLATHFKDFNVSPSHYDLIITGDLGAVGKEIAVDMLEARGHALRDRFDDCALVLYDRRRQQVDAGGSGTACSAGVFCAHIAHGMRAGKWRRVLLAPTGSLHSPVSYKQGHAIPAICHAVALEMI